jgi:hypothetical protein
MRRRAILGAPGLSQSRRQGSNILTIETAARMNDTEAQKEACWHGSGFLAVRSKRILNRCLILDPQKVGSAVSRRSFHGFEPTLGRERPRNPPTRANTFSFSRRDAPGTNRPPFFVARSDVFLTPDRTKKAWFADRPARSSHVQSSRPELDFKGRSGRPVWPSIRPRMSFDRALNVTYPKAAASPRSAVAPRFF